MKKITVVRLHSALAALVTLAFGALASSALAHSGEQHESSRADMPISQEEHAFGKQGDPQKAMRTIAIDMSDQMRFGPQEITVKEGEIIRFVVRNKGRMMHEMVIGTRDELHEHAELMRKFPGMEHDAPYMSHVSPGKQQEMVWQFTKAGEFHYACLIPGHSEAGMIGKITVTKG